MDYLTNFFQNVQLCYLLASAMKGKLNSKKKKYNLSNTIEYVLLYLSLRQRLYNYKTA